MVRSQRVKSSYGIRNETMLSEVKVSKYSMVAEYGLGWNQEALCKCVSVVIWITRSDRTNLSRILGPDIITVRYEW